MQGRCRAHYYGMASKNALIASAHIDNTGKAWKVDGVEKVKYRVIIEKDEDGVFVAKVPDLPGCATEGKTRKELMRNVKEAIKAYLEALKKDGNPVPVEVVQVSV